MLFYTYESVSINYLYLNCTIPNDAGEQTIEMKFYFFFVVFAFLSSHLNDDATVKCALEYHSRLVWHSFSSSVQF